MILNPFWCLYNICIDHVFHILACNKPRELFHSLTFASLDHCTQHVFVKKNHLQYLVQSSNGIPRHPILHQRLAYWRQFLSWPSIDQHIDIGWPIYRDHSKIICFLIFDPVRVFSSKGHWKNKIETGD